LIYSPKFIKCENNIEELMESNTLRCADALVKILEFNNVKFIFGHPGEQILPFYDSMRQSRLKHILMRHEQGAAHAADGYSRASADVGVCTATGGPGAMNLVMGIATAYKDSVPIIVITGDIPTDKKGKNGFQEIDICSVFKPITIESFDIKTPEQGILALISAFETIKYHKKGPIHLNFPKDVLESYVDASIVGSLVNEKYEHKIDDETLKNVFKLLENSRKPLILAGAGAVWSHASDTLLKFAQKYNIPVATTYPGRGIISEENKLSVGMIGIRSTDASKYAGKNCDLILGLGCRFSERTLVGIGDCKIIHINIDEGVLEGDIKIQSDIKEFLEKIMNVRIKTDKKWLLQVQEHSNRYHVDTDYPDIPIKPQRAIKEILDASNDSIIVNDAGTHTTWVTLLILVKTPSSLLFSGGFGPMGYGIPGAIGAAFAKPDKNIVAVVGDGDFQMTSQELATINEYDLPILVCIINNSSLSIIKQWQNRYYGKCYQVELKNPNFIKLSHAYHIPAVKIDSPGQISSAIYKALSFKKPYLIEIVVDKNEEIPLPEVSK
jgi:acetolactate synthase I/II/III large subunit